MSFRGKRVPGLNRRWSRNGAWTPQCEASAFGTVGALVALRVRGNPIGWILGATGLVLGFGNLAYQYADHALFVASPPLPGGALAAWIPFGVPAAFGLLGVSLLLFPDGRLPSRRWRPALYVSTIGIAANVIGYALRPGVLDEPFETVSNPLGVNGAFGLMDALSGLGWLLMAVGVALAAIAMVGRLRRSSGRERQQLKWIALAAAVAGVVMIANVASFFAAVEGINQLRMVLVGLAFVFFPIAAGIAILRHRLYDIDVVINRTLVYGGLTATLAAAYLGSVLLLQLVLNPLTSESGPAVAASTLAVAALIRPARARFQAVVDRRFYRRRYDAARTLEAFTARLRDEIDLEVLGADLRAVVRGTVQPAHVSLWLRRASRLDPDPARHSSHGDPHHGLPHGGGAVPDRHRGRPGDPGRDGA